MGWKGEGTLAVVWTTGQGGQGKQSSRLLSTPPAPPLILAPSPGPDIPRPDAFDAEVGSLGLAPKGTFPNPGAGLVGRRVPTVAALGSS